MKTVLLFRFAESALPGAGGSAAAKKEGKKAEPSASEHSAPASAFFNFSGDINARPMSTFLFVSLALVTAPAIALVGAEGRGEAVGPFMALAAAVIVAILSAIIHENLANSLARSKVQAAVKPLGTAILLFHF
jgi:hypothetical protein